jgi:hypothetical protein
MRLLRQRIWIPRSLYSAYCGEKSAAYLRHYDEAWRAGNPTVSSFDLLALLCYPAWLGYRQRWQLLAVFTAGAGSIGLAMDAMGLSESPAVGMSLGLLLGFAGRGLLLAEANWRYRGLIERRWDEAAVRAALADRAAPRPAFALLGFAASTLVQLGFVMLGDWLFGVAGAGSVP